jgi:putative oxidoreductase
MKNLLFNNQPLFPETSYFVLRLCTGIAMLYYHGWSKILSDSLRWERLGSSLSQWIGLDALAVPLGFMAAFSESIGSLLIALGLLTRPAAFLLGITMLVASSKKLSEAGIDDSELPLLFLMLSVVVLLKGPGKYSLDRILF